MSRIDPYSASDDAFDDAPEARILTQKQRARKATRKEWSAIQALSGESRSGAQAEDRGFAFTYNASRGERQWLLDALMPAHERGVITDVLRMVKGGKEATVYLCAGPDDTLLAAKVYRPRMFRNLRNDAAYRQGRQLRDASGAVMRKARELRAVSKRTGFGLQVMHESWLQTEVTVLTALNKAGADVPRLIESGSNAVLMSHVGDRATSAGGLISAPLDAHSAPPVFERVIENVRKLLGAYIVHGDLSGYNILFWQGQICLIDFPQASDPRRNPNAQQFFARDIARVCDCFAQWMPVPDPHELARALWAEAYRADLDEHGALISGRTAKHA